MKKQLLFLFSITVWAMTSFAQSTLYYNSQPGTMDFIKNDPVLKTANANSNIAVSYTHTACGLNYTQASVFLSQKSFTFGPGMAQPATMSVTGLPYCQSVLKAFLYISTSGSNTAITATLTNPQNVTNSFSMTNIGQGADVCWGYGASQSYRADVTSIVSGAGVYTLSGIPVGPSPGSDAQGATLFILFQDVTQNYSGSIIIADGAGVGLSVKTCTFGGFSICGPPVSSSNFMLVSDLQKFMDAPVQLNSATSNFTLTTANQTAHNFISALGAPVTVGQTTATYGVGSVGADCFNIVLAGMYYRSSCLTCTVAQTTSTNTPTLSIVSSSNVICAGGTVTLTASGASTYSWNNGSNSSSIVISPTTTTQYWVYSNNVNGCSNTLFTQSVVTCSSLKEGSFARGITLYPNPTKGQFQIGLDQKLDYPELTIFNSLGQLVFKDKLKEGINTVDVSKLSAGYYFVKVNSGGEIIGTEKLIIE